MSMSRRLERLLTIDQLLRSGKRITQGILTEHLEVKERTVRNDLHFLRDRYSAPLEYDQSGKRWYYTDPNWRLPSISLSQGELFALTLGAKMLESYVGSAYEKELRSSIERLSERLPEQTWVNLQRLADERIIFRPGAEMLNLSLEIWQQLLDAFNTSRRIWIRYYAATRNEESERVVDPYFLDIYRGSNPYLIGFCHKRQAIRDFRIDRIKNLRILDETFEKDSSFNAKAYLEKRFQNEGGDKLFSVTIWFNPSSAPFIKERRWHTSQKLVEHPDGSLTLHLVVAGLNDLKRWVLGYGKGAIVKEPQELVQLIKREVEEMSQHYKLSTTES